MKQIQMEVVKIYCSETAMKNSWAEMIEIHLLFQYGYEWAARIDENYKAWIIQQFPKANISWE
jgi:hypothetical protein